MSPLGIGVLIFVTLWLGALALSARWPQRQVVGMRLREIELLRTPREERLRLPFHQRALIPLVKAGAGLAMRVVRPTSTASVRRRLRMAGRRQEDAPTWIFLKWLSAAALGAAGCAVGLSQHWSPSTLLVGVASFGGIGYLWPEYKVGRTIQQRQARITRELPETLDLLTISVEAGLGLEQALGVVATRRPGPLSEEIRAYLEDVRLGSDRKEALKALGAGPGVEDLKTFTVAVAQAMDFGVSIGGVLRVQAQEVRTRSRMRIEERAQKAPVKLLFPLIFLILPVIFVVAAGPGLIRAYVEFIKPAQGTFGPLPSPGR